MNSECKTDKERLPRVVWLIYQALVWLYALVIIISSCVVLLHISREYVNIYKYLPYIEYSITLIFLISCIGAIARRLWAAHWVSVTGVWCLAMYWSDVPGLIECAVEEILYGPRTVLGAGPDLSRWAYPVYVYLLARLIGLGLLLALIITSHIVSRQQVEIGAETKKRRSIQMGRFLYGGILLIFLGVVVKWLDVHIERQIYAMTVGSYLVVAGVVLILIWHVSARDLFFAGSAVSMSAILFIYRPAIVPAFYNFLLWLPPVATGMLSLLRRHVGAKLRAAVIGLPVVFVLISFSSSLVEIPLDMSFAVYHKITSRQPEDFPVYLQVPPGATDARYRGGNRPYLYFTGEDPYPASKTVGFITANLEEAGWNKLEYDLLDPNFRSSHLEGWYSPLGRWFGPSDANSEHGSKRKPCLWDAYWINDRDETVHVSLGYRLSEERKTDWTTLHCNISQSPPDPWQLQRIRQYRRIHPDGNEPNKAAESSEHSPLF